MASIGNYQFPQETDPASLSPGERGICSISHPDVTTFRFRANPKEFNWSYTLNKRVDQTYGGRVIQLLGTRIDDFSFKADSGVERWDYSNRVANFMRDVMVAQRNGRPATFEYTTRGWKFNAYIVSVPFADAVEEVLREFEVVMKVQEDVTGLMSQNTLAAELRRLQDGIAFRRGKYNDPRWKENQNLPDSEIADRALKNTVQTLSGVAADVMQTYLPTGIANSSNFLNSIINGGKK